ncbi:MmgE/PrpD family protein [Chelativorans xinjiangense]|uniref:MmgE/PrpD family protein n=1 Tax=Chelativorans xinjiangense TaxID=2681485 RepID=UPI00135816B4|nr:MmgE/PrpD family protein [Chelativorans xinjiangense]
MTTRVLARRLAEIAVDARTEAAVALHTVDTLAALAAGLEAQEGAAIGRFLGEGDAASTAAAMAAVIRFTECDDIEVPSCLTPGCIAVPVAGEFAPDPRSYVRAVEAGYATGLCLARAVGGAAILARGVWPTLFAAPAIAAATAAAALDLDEETTAQALAIAIAGNSGRAGQPGGNPSGRWLAIGEATLKGVRAVMAARAGFGGDPALLSPEWLAAQSSAELAAPEHLEALPEHAVASVGLKPFVAARQGMNAIEAFSAMLADGLQPASVLSVEVELPPDAVPVVSRSLDPGKRLSTIAHLGLQLGIAAFERDRLFDVARAHPFDARTIAFAAKVTVRPESALAAEAGHSFPARVIVKTADGFSERRCAVLPGDAPLATLQRKIEGLGVAGALGGLASALRNGDAIDDERTRVHAALKARLGGENESRGFVRLA